MRVIHGVWAHGALCLWAEDPDLPPASGTELAGTRPPTFSLPQPHPFACQAAELADMLAERPGSQEAVRKAVHDELILQLPTAGAGRWPRRNSSARRRPGPRALRATRRPGAAGSRWRAGGCLCSPSARPPRSWCS